MSTVGPRTTVSDKEKPADERVRAQLKAAFLVLGGTALGVAAARAGISPAEAKVSAAAVREALASSGQGIPVPSLDSDPGGASPGLLYYNAPGGYLKFYDAQAAGFRQIADSGLIYPTPGGAVGDASIGQSLTLGNAIVFEANAVGPPYSRNLAMLACDSSGGFPIVGFTMPPASGSPVKSGIQFQTHDGLVFQSWLEDSSGNVDVDYTSYGTGNHTFYTRPAGGGAGEVLMFMYGAAGGSGSYVQVGSTGSLYPTSFLAGYDTGLATLVDITTANQVILKAGTGSTTVLESINGTGDLRFTGPGQIYIQGGGSANLILQNYTALNAGGYVFLLGGTQTGLSPANITLAPVKAGAPTDSDFTSPQDGLVVIDSSDARIYARYGGSWHYASLT